MSSKGISDVFFYIRPQGKYVSMGVLSDGSSYGIPEGIVYSYPMTIGSDRQWKIISGLPIDDFSREKMDKTAKELKDEKEACDAFLQD